MSEHEVWTFFAFVFGTLWGSFGNVVIVRMPKNENLVFPRSHCTKCQTSIPWHLNIPIFSWILLKGRCQKCKQKFSIRYPIVEFLMGLCFASLFYCYGWSFFTFEYFIFSFGLITASFIDIDHMILPDRLTLSGIVIGLIGAFINPDRSFLDAFWGVFVGGGFLLAISYFYWIVRKMEGMGGGDIKLIAWIGSVCGLQSILFVIIVSSLIGLVVGSFYIFQSKKGLKTSIPFGPYLSLAALIFLIFDFHTLLLFFI